MNKLQNRMDKKKIETDKKINEICNQTIDEKLIK